MTAATWEPAGPPAPFDRTPHLVCLLAETERLSAVIERGEPAPAVRESLTARAAVASMRLDGSPVGDVTEAEDAWQDVSDLPAAPRAEVATRVGTWLDALRAGSEPDRRLIGSEYGGVRAALAADDLTRPLTTDPLAALSELHRRLTRGLLDPAAAGRPRKTHQAVHDASVGRVVYYPSEPEQILDRLVDLAAWLRSSVGREHGLIVSGVAHQVLLEVHPFEAANGRLARAAARLLLRVHGLDPAGVGSVEIALERDPLGYYREVAKTMRRRDLTIWLERWGEAVAEGLRLAAHELHLLHPTVPARARRFLEGRGEPVFTIADYRAEVGTVAPEARADLAALLDAGRVRRVPSARGLRFTVT
ncbi:MAG: Fic family protein [Actinobacteria bacterium]|nr:Fic family protein [Actinomycetota bacterium]